MLKKSLSFICITLLLTLSTSSFAFDINDKLEAYSTGNQDLVNLGNALYFDTRLSSDSTVACASCHLLTSGDMAGDDGPLSVSVGVTGLTGTRNAQSVLNTGLMSAQFWDGRAPTLEAQAEGPFVNPVEMGLPAHGLAGDVTSIVQGITAYQQLFDDAFGGPATIDLTNITAAIAEFERTLRTPNSPFDNYLQDIDDTGTSTALTAQEVAGMNTFQSVGCTGCHDNIVIARQGPAGTAFLRNFPANPGNAAFIAFDATYDLTSDLGRGAFTGNPADNNRFKVQSLRNIALTAPYFHNGSVTDLAEAVRIMAAGQLNTTLTATQVNDIVAFLGSTTGDLPNPTIITVANNSVGIPVMHPGFALFLILALGALVKRRFK